MLNISLEPELEQRLQAIAAKSGHSTADLARAAIIEMIEDQEDLAAAKAVLAHPGRHWTMEEAARELDLKIEWADPAIKMMKRIDHGAQRQIFRYLASRIATDENPRRFGRALSGDRAGLWRYRIGDHRIVCKIEDDQLIVLVVAVGHRKLIYQYGQAVSQTEVAAHRTAFFAAPMNRPLISKAMARR